MKTILLTVVAALCWLPMSWAYSPDGPVGNGGDAWQIQPNGFGPPRDGVAPKNLGEEYRRNVPVVYYACDANFLDYFGSSGQTAVDNAFAVLNASFTNNPTGEATGLDGYSATLSEFPLLSRHVNYQAQALGLYDVKSFTLGVMMEQLGLADPTFYVYGLHDEYHVGNVACPAGEEYDVVMRNFDTISSPQNQLQYSPYINNILYTYNILEECALNPAPPWIHEVIPSPVDLLADPYTPLASANHTVDWGVYYTGLTRDDAGGLRHLLEANNLKWETVSPDSVQYLITTNAATPVVFPPYIVGSTNFVNGTNTGYYIFNGATNVGYGYGDLTAFEAFITTNDPAAVQAAYPGVVIASVTNTVTIVSNATIVAYYTNWIGSPYGSPPVLVVTTNYNPVFEILYYYTFANIFTNHYTKGTESLVTVSVGAPVGSPYGSPGVTNITVRKIPTISADFFVLPLFYTNVCPIDILPKGSIPTVLTTSNLLSISTNNISGVVTNAATNFVSYVYLVTSFTNFSYVIAPVTCTTIAGATGLYEGIEKIQFVRTNYDSLLGQYFYPITNNYTMKSVTNGQVQVQYFQRIVTQPDYLFTAQDLTPGGNSGPILQIIDDVTIPGFDQANILPGLAGPGTINAPTSISFNKVGPVFFNSPDTVLNGTPYLTEILGSSGVLTDEEFFNYYVIWASFDGTTNAPVVYPNGTSIDNLQYQILVDVAPATVPAGKAGTAYGPVTFTATSSLFVPPFTWSAAGLPPGLSLSSNGILSGTPTQSGSSVFTLTVTDSMSRSVQWNYSITIQ